MSLYENDDNASYGEANRSVHSYAYDYDSEYDSETIVSHSTQNSRTKKKRYNDESHLVSMPNVYTITKVINGKNTKIKLFETKEKVNARIINAVTGIPYFDDENKRYRYVVGSKQEDDLFKVKMLAGLGKNTALLFYESPDQYERHQHCTLDDKIKQKWQEKNRAYRKLIERDLRQ